MSTPAEKLYPPRRSIKKIQNLMPAPIEIFKEDLSWLCTKGDRYEFVASNSKILEYQLQRGKETFGTVTLAKHNTSVSSSSSSSSSSNSNSSTNNLTILVSLKIYIPCMRHDISARLKKYSKFIVNYEEIIAKKSDKLHLATSVFTYEAKKALEEFGVATELTQLISDTITPFQSSHSIKDMSEHPITKPSSHSSSSSGYHLNSDSNDADSSVRFDFTLDTDSDNADTDSSPSFSVNSSPNRPKPSLISSPNSSTSSNSSSSSSSSSSSNFNSSDSSNSTARPKRRYMQTSQTSNQKDQKAENVKDTSSSFKRGRLSFEETEKQRNEIERVVPPLLFSRNIKDEIPNQPPEETYSIIQGSYEEFKANNTATLIFKRSKADNCINQLILSKSIQHSIFLENPIKTVYVIKIVLDATNPHFRNYLHSYRETLRLEDLKDEIQKIYLFNRDVNDCLVSRPLKQEHFIFLLGKLRLPDEITLKLSEFTRTFSDLYNQSQTPTHDQPSRSISSNTIILSPPSNSNSGSATEVESPNEGQNQRTNRSKSFTKK